MNCKELAIFLAALFILKLTAAVTIKLHESIIKANGERTTRNWEIYDEDESQLDNKNHFQQNVFQDGVNYDNVLLPAPLLNGFGRKQINENDMENWLEIQKQATEKRNPSYGLQMSQIYHVVPMPVHSTDNYNEPKIHFTDIWADIFRDRAQQENSPQNSWQSEAKNPNLATISETTSDDKKIAQETDNNDSPMPTDAALNELLNKIFEKDIKSQTKTTVKPFNTQHRSAFDVDEDVPTVEDEKNLEVNDNNDNLTFTEFLNKVLAKDTRTSPSTTLRPFLTQRMETNNIENLSIAEDEDYLKISPELSDGDNYMNFIRKEYIR